MKENFLEKAARSVDIPPDILAGTLRIEIIGTHEIYIENHQGILEYGTQQMDINCGEMTLRLTGEGFVIRTMNARELRLQGLIFHIEFIY